jgi:coatomer subunit beta
VVDECRQGICRSCSALYCKHGIVLFSGISCIKLPIHFLYSLTHFLCCTILVLYYSVFGEDALVNVSVEKKDDNDGKLAGYIRIRSKTQGIALSLGDRITTVQRGLA